MAKETEDFIISISIDDIVSSDITGVDIGGVMSHIALTEAVYYILLSLQEPMHGYGIMQNVQDLTKGRLVIAAGTLYGVLKSLMEKGWITALPEEKESRRKEYQITKTGKDVFDEEILRLQELLENGLKIRGERHEKKNL